jgi:4-hydroxybenzoate polyprenyltransferase
VLQYACRRVIPEGAMSDALVLLVIVLFFLLSFALVKLCEKLR